MLLPFSLIYFGHEHPLSFIYLHLCFLVKVKFKSPEKAHIIFGIWLVFLQQLDQLCFLHTFLLYLRDRFQLLFEWFCGLSLKLFIRFEELFYFLFSFCSLLLHFLSHFLFAQNELVVNLCAECVSQQHRWTTLTSRIWAIHLLVTPKTWKNWIDKCFSIDFLQTIGKPIFDHSCFLSDLAYLVL